MMGKVQARAPKLFYAGVNLDERVPQDHLLRQLAAAVDFSRVRVHVAACYGSKGHESLDPILILKLMLLCFLENVRSERELVKILPLRLDWLWFCQLDLDSPIPHHSVLSKARIKWGEECFAALFGDVLKQCIQAGLVQGDVGFADSTLLKAQADVASRVPRNLWNQLQAATQAASQDSPAAIVPSGPEALAPTAPVASRVSDTSVAATPPTAVPAAPKNAPAPKALGQGSGKTAPSLALADRPKGLILPKAPTGAFNQAWVSRTDPDAGTTKRRGRGITLGYRDHRLIDNGFGIVLSTVATGAHYHDAALLPVLLDQAQEIAGIGVRYVVGDSQYGSRENRQRMKRRHIQAYLKTCKNRGQAHLHWSELLPKELSIPKACRLFKRRQHVAEGRFAEAHQRMDHRRCRWRGRSKVQMQCYLVAIVQNAKKLARYRNPGPGRKAARRSLSIFACQPHSRLPKHVLLSRSRRNHFPRRPM